MSLLVHLDTLIQADPDFRSQASGVCWSVTGLQAPADSGLSLTRRSSALADANFETAGYRPERKFDGPDHVVLGICFADGPTPLSGSVQIGSAAAWAGRAAHSGQPVRTTAARRGMKMLLGGSVRPRTYGRVIRDRCFMGECAGHAVWTMRCERALFGGRLWRDTLTG